MDWTKIFVKSIDYIENNINERITIDDIAHYCNISSYYFQRTFQIYSGMTIAEYIRNRRLYLSAIDLRTSNLSISDIAFKYCYENVESFSKAFYRFHGSLPSVVRSNSQVQIKLFQRLYLQIIIKGGYEMDYRIEHIDSIKFIGFYIDVENDKGNETCPKFWDEVKKKYFSKVKDGSEISRAIVDNCIGEYAVCLDNISDNTFRYIIAGEYKGGKVPNEMIVHELKDITFAKFKCVGPMPTSIQVLTNKIFKEWLPNNQDYEISDEIDIEWYSGDNVSDSDYKSEVWIPVKHK